MPRVYTHLDLTERKFGHWLVLSLGEPKIRPDNGSKVIRWLCRCDCGVESLVVGEALVRGKSRNCEKCGRWADHTPKPPEQKREEHNKYVREVWYPANQDRVSKKNSMRQAKLYTTDRRYASNLKANFGITLEEYEGMLEKQNGCCAICGRSEPDEAERTKRLCVDHDHDTGKIRALLCHKCNKALGLLQESPALLQKAAEYLLTHQEERESHE